MRFAALLASACAALALVGASDAVARPTASYFPTLKVSIDPFIVAGLDSASLHAWSGSASPTLTFTTSNGMPIAASFSVTSSSGTTLTVSHPDIYSQASVIDSGATLHFSGRLASGTATATVTFSIVSNKALAVNLLAGATPASTINDLAGALEKGAGATLSFELRREINGMLTGKESRIVFARNLSAFLIKFGANRQDRKWLLDNFVVHGATVVWLASWAGEVAQAFGAYAGLTHAGVDGAETLVLSAVRTPRGAAASPIPANPPGGKHLALKAAFNSRAFSCPANALEITKLIGRPMSLETNDPGMGDCNFEDTADLDKLGPTVVLVNFNTYSGNVSRFNAAYDELKQQYAKNPKSLNANIARFPAIDPLAYEETYDVATAGVGVVLHLLQPNRARSWVVENSYEPSASPIPPLPTIKSLVLKLVSTP